MLVIAISRYRMSLIVVTLMVLTTHSICGWPPVDADSCQSTLFSVHLQTGTTNALGVHVAHIIVAGLLIILVRDKLVAFLKGTSQKIQVRIRYLKTREFCVPKHLL